MQLWVHFLSGTAKSLQSCPTRCDPIDGSPPGSLVPGILQARTLERVAISFSNAWKWKVKVKSLSRVRLLATSRTAAHQAPPSMGFSRQEYWSGVPLPSPLSGTSHVLCAWKPHGYCNWGSESIVAFHFNWLKWKFKWLHVARVIVWDRVSLEFKELISYLTANKQAKSLAFLIVRHSIQLLVKLGVWRLFWKLCADSYFNLVWINKANLTV